MHDRRSATPVSGDVGSRRSTARSRAAMTTSRSRADDTPRLTCEHRAGLGPVDVDHQIDTVHERTADPATVAVDLPGLARARTGGVAEEPAATRVSRTNEGEPGREGQPPIGPHDGDDAVLERLAQALQCRRGELGHLVEEQHSVVRETRLSGLTGLPPPTSPGTDAEWCGARKGRWPARAADVSRPATECTSAVSSLSCLCSGGRIEGSRLDSIVLPEPGGPTRSTLWAPAAAITSARSASSCPATSAKSTSCTASRIAARARPERAVPPGEVTSARAAGTRVRRRMRPRCCRRDRAASARHARAASA